MARKPTWPPKIHTRGGKDWCRFRLPGGGTRDFTLGPAGSAEARAEYARLLAEAEAQGCRAPLRRAAVVSVNDLVAAHLAHAEERHPGRQADRVKRSLAPAALLYGTTPAADFGPVQLRACRQHLVSQGKYCRKVINSMTGCIRACWKWGASHGLAPHLASAALYDVPDLRRCDVGAPPDHPPVAAVLEADVLSVLPHCGRQVASLLQIQLLTGMRPGEAVRLRPGRIDRAWKAVDGVPVWLYRPEAGHKGEWRERPREIAIGPKAQAVLAPFLLRDAQAYCFSPAEAAAGHQAARAAARKTKRTPSELRRSRGAKPGAGAGARYTSQAYGLAVARACERAGVPTFSPNMVRKRAITDIETEGGREDSRCVAGHSTPSTTAIYARQVERAAKVMARRG